MIEFTIGKENFKIENIKLKDVYAINSNGWAIDNLDSKINIIAQLSGCKIELIEELTTTQFNELWSTINDLFNEFSDESRRFQREVTINGVEYGIVDLNQVSVGEFADAEMILADPNIETMTHKLMAIIYRPVVSRYKEHFQIEKYDAVKCSQRANEFLELPINVAKGATLFFLAISNQLISLTLDSLKARVEISKTNESLEEVKLLEIQIRLLKLLGDGTTSLTQLQGETLLNMIEQLKLESKQLLTFLQEEKISSKKIGKSIRNN